MNLPNTTRTSKLKGYNIYYTHLELQVSSSIFNTINHGYFYLRHIDPNLHSLHPTLGYLRQYPNALKSSSAQDLKIDTKKASGTGEIEESDDEEEAQEPVNSFQTGDNSVVSDSNDGDLDDGGDEDEPAVNDGELAEEDELTLEDVEDLEDDVYTSTSCPRSLAKLKKSPNSKARFIEICQESQCQKPHNIERDVPTRWNLTFKQLESIV
ncbi:hypothetical protein H4Q26_003994 [Puccinia striiformis f. sp. tritici PST-130]|nr:hypothetical protein H4Q26_003994 [Puccinia striiformis f. sp. tritici PST-130]